MTYGLIRPISLNIANESWKVPSAPAILVPDRRGTGHCSAICGSEPRLSVSSAAVFMTAVSPSSQPGLGPDGAYRRSEVPTSLGFPRVLRRALWAADKAACPVLCVPVDDTRCGLVCVLCDSCCWLGGQMDNGEHCSSSLLYLPTSVSIVSLNWLRCMSTVACYTKSHVLQAGPIALY